MKTVKQRVARPTSALEPLRAFYVDGLGLMHLGGFAGHAGYDGLILGTSDGALEVEFTTDGERRDFSPPTRDNLLVLYVEDDATLEGVAEGMKALGHLPVRSVNPYWDAKGHTWEDPDGWRVVVASMARISP